MKKKNEAFENIIGYENEKKLLKRVIDVLNHQDKYKKIGSTIPHGLFIYGPPGLGKSTISQELLNQVNNRKAYIIRKIKSDGEFINYMSDIFALAKKNQPSIILLDDLDKFAELSEDKGNNEEFVAVQSFIDDIKNDDIFIVATANNKNCLPNSLLRAGRFDIKLKIDYPKEKDSVEIFKHYLKNKRIDKSVNVQNVSYILGSASCADLEKVCNQASIYAGFMNKNAIGMDELLRAALEFSYDTNIEDDESEDKYALNTAYHEAGHAVVAEMLEPGSISFITTLKTDSLTKGLTKYWQNDYYWQDIDFMINRLTALLGGRAATEIIYHKCDVGATLDLERAYNIADRLVDNYCLMDFCSWVQRPNDSSEKVKCSRDNNINQLIAKYYHQAKEIIIANQDKLDTLAHLLCDKKIVFQDEIQNIMKTGKENVC